MTTLRNDFPVHSQQLHYPGKECHEIYFKEKCRPFDLRQSHSNPDLWLCTGSGSQSLTHILVAAYRNLR